MRKVLSLLAIFCAALGMGVTSVHASTGSGQRHNHRAAKASWYWCVITDHGHLCHAYPVRKAPRRPVGWWKTCTPSATALPRVCARYPKFQLPPIVDMAPAARSLVSRWTPEIAYASRVSGVPTRAIAAIIATETRGIDTCTSGDGLSSGLSQVVPSTGVNVWQMHGAYYTVAYVAGRLCADKYFDVLTGAWYLLYQYQRWGYSWSNAAGAYNCGSCVYQPYVAVFNSFYYG